MLRREPQAVPREDRVGRFEPLELDRDGPGVRVVRQRHAGVGESGGGGGDGGGGDGVDGHSVMNEGNGLYILNDFAA